MKWTIASSVLILTILTACSSPTEQACVGWKRIDVPEDDKTAISRDLKLQIAGHNLYGEEIDCWENE